jgi:hypothetical protein
VRNNPLKYTDPSGHSFWSIIKTLIVVAIVAAVSYAVLLHGFGLTAAMVKTGLAIGSQYVLSAVMVSGAIAGFVGGVAGALLDGASPSQAFIAGLTGFVMGGLTAGISNAIGKMSNILARSISHGIVGGIRAIIQGGNFLSGFMSSFASTVLQPIGTAIAKGNYYARATFSALVGGTVSVIGGGKFANGAVTSAFQFMYNDWMHEKNTKANPYKKNFLFVSLKKMTRNEYNEQYKNNPQFKQSIERGRRMHEAGKPYAKALMAGGTTGVVAIVGGEAVVVTRAWIISHPNEVASFVQGYSAVNNYNPIGKNAFYHFGRATREVTDWLSR